MVDSICSLAALISFLTMPDNFVFLGIAFVFTKLYINSYLAMLNARKSLRDSVVNMEQLSDIEMSHRMTGNDTQSGLSIETTVLGARDKGVKVGVNIGHQSQ
ncbi:hypothetical protein AX14_011932 [Amanita brunnescens Koide BX004]|nr:hypothetical protein AX14_011932 [Amanita brunnescens Koide BX004]